MRPFALLCIVALALAGCEGPDDGARAALKANLKDPDSAKFEESITYHDFKCLKYNAKNGFGGYAGPSWAILEKSGSRWTVVKPSESACFESTLKDLAHPDHVAQKEKANDLIMGALHAGRIAPESVHEVYDVPTGPCWYMATEMRSYAHLSIDAETPQDKAHYQQELDKLLALAKQGTCKSELGPKT